MVIPTGLEPKRPFLGLIPKSQINQVITNSCANSLSGFLSVKKRFKTVGNAPKGESLGKVSVAGVNLPRAALIRIVP